MTLIECVSLIGSPLYTEISAALSKSRCWTAKRCNSSCCVPHTVDKNVWKIFLLKKVGSFSLFLQKKNIRTRRNTQNYRHKCWTNIRMKKNVFLFNYARFTLGRNINELGNIGVDTIPTRFVTSHFGSLVCNACAQNHTQTCLESTISIRHNELVVTSKLFMELTEEKIKSDSSLHLQKKIHFS
jgi:hypothetical protein